MLLVQKKWFHLFRQKILFPVALSSPKADYLKQYQRFKSINQYKSRIEHIFKEIKNREKELKKLDGYDAISEWVEQILKLFVFVEKGIILFENAVNHFRI